MTPKRIIYVKYFEDDDLGEANAFYEKVKGKLKLITAWSINDAHYRDEYMSPLFSYLGVTVIDLPKRYEEEARRLLCAVWGI